MTTENIDSSDILPEEIKRENILTYGISFKTFMCSKPLRLQFDKIDEFIKIYGGMRYLVLYDYKRYKAIYDRIIYLISEKINITDSINHNFARIRINSYNSSPPIEKTSTFHNVTILIKSVANKNINYYYNNIFQRSVQEKDKSNTQYL